MSELGIEKFTGNGDFVCSNCGATHVNAPWFAERLPGYWEDDGAVYHCDDCGEYVCVPFEDDYEVSI